jgi:hypothetical protein
VSQSEKKRLEKDTDEGALSPSAELGLEIPAVDDLLAKTGAYGERHPNNPLELTRRKEVSYDSSGGAEKARRGHFAPFDQKPSCARQA